MEKKRMECQNGRERKLHEGSGKKDGRKKDKKKELGKILKKVIYRTRCFISKKFIK